MNAPLARPVLSSDSKGSELPAHLSGDLPLVSGTEPGCYFLPFSLAAWFMGDPFPLHQLLHCIGVDYWSDWVAFVSPRVLLFHCLFPPESLGKKTNQKTNRSVLSLSNCSSCWTETQLCCEHAACLFLSYGWVQHNMLFWEGTQSFSKFSLQRSGSWNRALVHSPETPLLFSLQRGQRTPIPNGKGAFLPASKHWVKICALSGLQ